MTRRRLGITPKLTLLLVAFAAVLLGGLGALSYTNGRAALQAATQSELALATTEKQAALDAWVAQAQSDIAQLTRLPSTAEAVAALVDAVPGSAEALAAHDELVAELNAFDGPNTVLSAFLVMDPASAQVIAATNPMEEGQFREDRQYFFQGKVQPYVQNVYFSLTLQSPAMTAAAPVMAADGRLLAVLAGRLNLAGMNAILQRRTGERQTDEAFLVNTSSLFVTQPRLISNPAVLQRGVHTLAVRECLAGHTGFIEALDYRDIPALIAYRWLPDRNLCLIAKIDRAEAEAPIQRFGLLLAVYSGLILLGASAVALWLAQSVTRPLLSLRLAAARFAQGDLQARSPETSTDELGALAREFNLMAAALAAQSAQQRQRLEQLYNLSIDMIAVAGFDGYFKDLNPAWEKTLGFTTAELLARPLIEWVHPDDQPATIASGTALTQGQPLTALETRYQCKDGAWRWLQWNAVADAQHQLIYAVVHDVTDQKAAADRLRDSEAELRALFAAMPDVILTLSAEGRYLKIAPTGTNLLFRPADSLLGRLVTEVLPPEPAAQSLGWIQQALRLGQPVGGEYALLIEGREMWFAATVSPMTADSVVWVARDITERLEAARAVARERHIMRASIEAMGDGLIVADLTGKFLVANRAAKQILGTATTDAPLDEWSAKYGAFLPDGQTRCPTEDLPLVQALRGESSRNVELVIRHAGRPEGGMIAINGAPLQDDDGRVWGGVVVFHDITARRQAEAELRDSEDKFKYIFDHSPIGKSITTPSGSLHVNRAFCEMLGYSLDEIQNVNWQALTHPDDLDASRQVVASLLANEAESGRFTKRYLHKNGSIVWTDVSTSLRRDGEGRPLYFLTAIVNITDRKLAEQALARQADDLRRSNAELEQFAYVASHDLQEPLRMVSSYVQLLAKRYQGRLDLDADEFVGYAVDGANRMKRLIGDLLAYSRVGTRGKEFVPVDCEVVLRQTLASLQLQIEDTQASVTHDPLPTITGDSGQLTQLLQNLIGNALKFHGEQPPRVHIGAVRQDGDWLLSVADNGIGLEMQYAERIFVIFQRLHSKEEFAGTGIGLAICKKIVERHAGRLWVESQPGHGATFYFTLPAGENPLHRRVENDRQERQSSD